MVNALEGGAKSATVGDPLASDFKVPETPPPFGAIVDGAETIAAAESIAIESEYSVSSASVLSATKEIYPWHVLFATWLGGVADGMDSSIFAIILYPALSDLLHTTSHATVGIYGSYVIALFMLGWAAGAFFFGWLADQIGRAKTLSLTILVYAVATGLCAFSHSWWDLGIYRFLTGAGIGGEMGIGAVLLSECWPRKSRVFALSLLATSLGVGYLTTSGLNLLIGGYGWRNLFLVGILPAFLVVYTQMKLKDSHSFHEIKEKRAVAKGKHENDLTDEDRVMLKSTFMSLWDGQYARRTVVVGLLTSCAIIAWWAVLSWIPAWINQLTGTLAVAERSHVMLFKDIGMICSGLFGGLLIHRFGYKASMAGSFVLAFAATAGMFMTFKEFSPMIFPFVACVGFFAHIPFVLLWSYIPELFETRIRSTAFGVTYNVGRTFAAFAAIASGQLIGLFAGSYAMAATTFASIFLVGAVVSFFMPTPSGDMIEDGVGAH